MKPNMSIAPILCLVGCAAGVQESRPATPATAVAADRSELRELHEAQVKRLSELEARVALLEAEARARRSTGRSMETVRIGQARRRAAASVDSEIEEEVADDARPVVRVIQESARASVLEPFRPPTPPAGVPPALAVVPLPEDRTAEALGGGKSQDRQARSAYRSALSLLRERRYADALAAFDRFLERYPAHALSDNAVYWKGEAHYAERRYDEALTEFAAVLTRFPDSNKAADSLLKAGMCHLRLGNETEAARYFERVRAQYPNSDAARAVPREGSS